MATRPKTPRATGGRTSQKFSSPGKGRCTPTGCPRPTRGLRELTEADVTFTLECEEEDIPVRGNALASGDEQADRDCENEIIARLDEGDLWAWCCVKVTARWRGHEGVSYLCGCSYEDEESFKHLSGYYPGMRSEALADLNQNLRTMNVDLEELRAES